MTTISPVLLSDLSVCQAFLVLSNVSPTIGRRLASFAAMIAEVRSLGAGTELRGAIGIGATLGRAWLRPSPPKALASFQEFRGKKHAMPATQGELCVLVEGDRPDLVFEAVLRARRSFGGGATVVEEIHGFRYLDGRDLSGFIDGTGNPPPEERAAVVLIDGEDPAFTGGSYLFAQRWIHDLDALRRMSIPEREKMIGRRLSDNVELGDADKPIDAHMSRVEIVENGVEQAIFRKSFPYGDTREHGLMFLAFTRNPSIVNRMLANMVGVGVDDQSDRLFGFSRPVSGGFYFVPTQEMLEAIAAP